jgi:hypothetical protein
MSDKKVLLRNLDSKDSQPFAADHAKRLLAYPGTRWVEIAEDEKPSVPAAKKRAAGDATGMPESV